MIRSSYDFKNKRGGMINDHGLVVIQPLGKFHQQPLLLAPLVFEKINSCPLVHKHFLFFIFVIFSTLLFPNR